MTRYPLKVSALTPASIDAKTITFDVPDDLKSVFQYQPGQFITLQLEIDGRTVRRAYSLNGAPACNDPLQITVKQLSGGCASVYCNETLAVGDTLNVGKPAGKFTPTIDEKQRCTWYFFAAGSGITPVYAMLKQVLRVEKHSHVLLYYANHNEDHMIFGQGLEGLAQDYGDRFRYLPILSQPKSAQWPALWRKTEKWHGMVGRTDKGRVQEVIQQNPPPAQRVRYCLCGPTGFMATVRESLLDIDVPEEDIWSESFGGSVPQDRKAGMAATLEASISGRQVTVQVGSEQTLLEAMTAAGHDIPYSCQSGVCGTCVARLDKGKVHMKAHMALSDEERKQGKILTCQAKAAATHLKVRIP